MEALNSADVGHCQRRTESDAHTFNPMSELDRLKEQLVYLRLWLGVVVVAEISLIGWLASAVDTAPARLLALAIATALLLGLGIFSAASPNTAAHRRHRKARWTSL